MKTTQSPVGPVVETDDGPKLLFCSNDYLGLASDPRIASVVAESFRKWGSGSGGSRLISGNSTIHDRLEKDLARFLEVESAVLFTSGYQANVGALTSLVGKGDCIFSDELVHASLIDGCRLSKAQTYVYNHCDSEHLSLLLEKHCSKGVNLIVTDAVFSMDGDRAPLCELLDVAEHYGAELYVDEAHSFGALGPLGKGLCAADGVDDRVAIRMGTFGKALGMFGAFIATDLDAAGILTSRARSLLYTTAVPAAVIEGMKTALELTGEADDLRIRLSDNVALFKKSSVEQGLPILDSDTAIQPVMIGQAEKTMKISKMLWNAGIFVQGIRPPTVPEGTSRLRITMSAAHETEHIQRLVDTLAEVLAKVDS